MVKMLYMVQHIADNWVIVDQLGNLVTICKCVSVEKEMSSEPMNLKTNF